MFQINKKVSEIEIILKKRDDMILVLISGQICVEIHSKSLQMLLETVDLFDSLFEQLYHSAFLNEMWRKKRLILINFNRIL